MVFAFGYWMYDALARGNWKEFLIALTIFIVTCASFYGLYKDMKQEDD